MANVKLATLKMSVGRLRKKLNPDSGPVTTALTMWARIYRAFVLTRFDKFSRGGGDWPKLSPATIEAKRSTAILVDTRLMRLGLGTGIGVVKKTGRLVLHVTFGFTNKVKHPRTQGLTISDLASIHDQGKGVPKRTILAKPDARTTKSMANAIASVLAKK